MLHGHAGGAAAEGAISDRERGPAENGPAACELSDRRGRAGAFYTECILRNDDSSQECDDSSLENGGFSLENDGFSLENGGFSLENDGFSL